MKFKFKADIEFEADSLKEAAFDVGAVFYGASVTGALEPYTTLDIENMVGTMALTEGDKGSEGMRVCRGQVYNQY